MPPTVNSAAYSHIAASDRMTRGLIYVYFFLMIFEGAVRKWLLPGLSTPLLLVRDPVMLMIIFFFLSAGRRLLNGYTLTLLFTGLLSFFLSLAYAHGSVFVGLFGLRTLVMHFFIIFIMARVFDRRDVERIGRYCVYLLPPIVLLIALQFYSSPEAFVNRGVGGEEGGGSFGGTMGFFRPSGPFSFTLGLTTYLGLCVAYVAYFWGEPRRGGVAIHWLLLATVAVLVAIPLSISRSYLFEVLITVLFFVIASFRSGRSIRKLAIGAALAPVLLLLLSGLGFVQTAIEVLVTRFELAARSEGGLEGTLGERFLGGLLGALTNESGVPLYGQGLGLGTNVASAFLTGERTFLVAEGEWRRIVGEMGPILGLPVVLVRIVLSVHLMLRGGLELLRGYALPFMLLSFAFLQVLQAQWSQPTTLGLSVFAGGLVAASFNDTDH